MCLCPYLERTQTTQTRATPAATSRSRLTAGCAHTPCGRVIASSLRLSHAAAALWSLRMLVNPGSNAQSRLRQQLATNGSESDALLRRRRVCVGRERARAMSKPERLAILCSFLNESGDYCISFIRMRPEKSGK